MDAVKAFNDELSSIYETKPPVSRAKMTILTKKAIKGIKFYKHIVQSMEKFIQKCRPEYKVPGLYVIDSVVRQSRHQFGQEKDVFMPRLCKNILSTFKHLYKCPLEEKQRIIRVLNLWQKNNVFPPEIVQQLLVMGGASASGGAALPAPMDSEKSAHGQAGPSVDETTSSATNDQPDTGALTNMLAQLLANPNNPQIQQLTGLLSTSQQAQLQALVSQVKGQQDQEEPAPPAPPQPEPPQESSVFLPRQDNGQPPFLQSEMEVGHSARAVPSFNRAVLDYDYSDDESPKSQERNKASQSHHNKPGIDMELLAKLPTVDQLKQLSGQISNGDDLQQNSALQIQDSDDRRQRLEAEQEVFSKQIQQMNEEEQSQIDRNRRSTSGRRRSRSRKRSRSRSRDRRRHRKRSRSRSYERRRRRSRSHERHRSHQRSSRSADREREKDRERERKGLPPLKEGCISLCTKTLWIGNLASKVSQQEINAEVDQYGPIESINMIPPRGCAYICMEKREDAAKALHKLRHTRIGGKVLKVDWAPGKEVKDEYKEFWSKDDGVNYIPLEKVSGKLAALKTQGFIDVESVPGDKRAELEGQESSESKEVNRVPVQPGVVPPVAGMMNSQMLPGGVPVMMRPSFPFPGMNPTMAQFGTQQRMPGFQMPTQSNSTGTVASAVDLQTTQKQEFSGGSKTPTQDEQKLDGAQKAAAVAASIMSSVQPSIHQQQVTVAQPRFAGVGQVPVQIRMVHGMPPQQVMSAQRIGMMPIRMGMPMQFRPGFARVPMGQPMVPFQQPQLGMQRMGQMLQPMRQGPPVRLPGGPVGLRNPAFPGLPESSLEKEGRLLDGKKHEEAEAESVAGHQASIIDENMRPDTKRSRFVRPPVDDRERTMRMGDIPLMDDRMCASHPMEGRRPPMMNERPTFRFRGSPPPARFGFGRRHPVDGPDEPRFPGRDRFPERGMERDERRRDDFRRRDRSPDRRDRDRRDRVMRERDRRYNDRDRRGHGFGEWGRERGRFGGQDGFGGRGRGREGFSGDSHFGDCSRGQFKEEPNPEDVEYQRKRDEVLRQRREKEDDYVAEEVDLSAFGLPSGFGAPSEEKAEESKEGKRQDRRDDKDDDRRRDRDRDRRDDYDRDRDRRDRRRDDRDRSRRDRRRSRSRDRDRDRKDNDKRSGGDGNEKDDADISCSNKKIKLEDEANTKDEVDKPAHSMERQSSSSGTAITQEISKKGKSCENLDGEQLSIPGTWTNDFKPEVVNHDEVSHFTREKDCNDKPKGNFTGDVVHDPELIDNIQEAVPDLIPQNSELLPREISSPTLLAREYDQTKLDISEQGPVHGLESGEKDVNYEAAETSDLNDHGSCMEQENQSKITSIEDVRTEADNCSKLEEGQPPEDTAMQ